MRNPPNVNVTPQVVQYASNGGFSTAIAQLVFGGSMPTVPRPSLTVGLYGTSRCTAALNSATVRKNRGLSTGAYSAILSASSSIVLATTLVTWRMRYSSRLYGTVCWSKICQA